MTRIARASATNQPGAYVVDIRAGRHQVTADEPVANGGTGTAPSPFGLLLSGLAACTAITLRMYAQRKQWPLEDVHVDLDMTGEETGEQRISRVLRLDGPLDDEQRGRLLEISEKTPVTKAVRAGVPIDTRLA
jgi:putative redox protein